MSPKSFHKEEIEGKTVIDSMGNVRGKIKDLIFSLDGSVALIIENMEGGEARVPLTKVLGISDYVIMRTDVAPDVSMPPMQAMASPPMGSAAPSFAGVGGPMACKFCGTPIPADSTYCPGCGRSKV
ncbi:MAG TPA: PRC-barrel domain-containing protein [Nitrososphaerales archaeon]|nr:PRC-barrel domain-containing protein [Nitrososphaerales archaeon]